jgi:hypothetical protein
MTNTTMNLGPMNRVGTVWSGVIGEADLYRVGGQRVALAPDGSGFLDGSEGFTPATPEVTAEAVRQAQEDAGIRRSRRAFALAQGGENLALAEAVYMGTAFFDGEPLSEEDPQLPGVLFFQVGRNSTHAFYAGASPDGQRFYRSAEYGEDEPARVKALGAWDEVGYWGHC